MKVLSTSEITNIAITATGMIEMNFPMTPVTYISGMNAMMVVATDAQTAGKTSAVVAPPSIHASGSEYAWLVDPETTDLAVAPEWLIDFVTGKSDQPSRFTVEDDSKLADHPGAEEGDRNATLCRLVGRHLAKH